MKKLLITLSNLLLSGVLAVSQTAPGGVGDLSGTSELRLWVSSQSSNVSINNTPVDTLYDLSGAGNHLVAPSTIARPVLLTNQINGYPAINFNGSQQYLLDPAWDTSFHNNEATLITVVSQNISGGVVSISDSNSVDEFLMLGRAAYHHSSYSNWCSLDHQCALTDSASQYVIETGVYGTAPFDVQNFCFSIPSTSSFTTDPTPVPYNAVNRKVHIGQRDFLQSFEYLNGNLIEVLGYNRKLTLIELDSVTTYLENKYQITEHCTTVGINKESTENNSVTIFPNPFTFQTTINFVAEQKNTTIQITDLLGQTIKAVNFTGRRLVVDKAEMKAGIYFMQTTDEKKNITNNKIIIQ